MEEGGQRVGNRFWHEAHGADVPRLLRDATAPCSLVFGTDDEYVSTRNRGGLLDVASARDRIDVFEGYPHSAWTWEQADDVIERSTTFLTGLPPT